MAMSVRYLTVDGEILSEKRGADKRDYLPDPLGSTAALLDSSQIKSDTFTYWPYGEVRTRTGSTPTPFQFVGTLGYYTDLGTDRVYVRARIYIPSLGRWLTADPLWPREDAYGYAALRPVMVQDASGRAPLRQGSNYGKCAVYKCSELAWDGGIGGWIPTHMYLCVTGPNGGCAGGLYPKGGPWGLGDLGNQGAPCGSHSGIKVNCIPLSVGDCQLAAAVCACLKGPVPHYLFPISTCYTFPNFIIGCACDKLKFKPKDCVVYGLKKILPPPG